MKSVFSGDMCVGKNTAQPASVRAKRVRRRRLHPFEHVLARAREPVDFVDRLRAVSLPAGEGKRLSVYRKSANASDLVQEPRRVPSSADDGRK